MRLLKPASYLLLAASVGACATGAPMSTAESVTRLEQQRHTDPTSAAINRSLGIAYYKAQRYAEAKGALQAASKIDPRDGTTALYLGLTDEALGDFVGARAAYSSYIEYGRTSRVRGQLQERLVALTQKELAQEAKKAVAEERSMATQAGSPRVVAVLPMRFAGADTSLKPLERGLTDLLTTDLARSSQITLVERARVQALMDEVTLQQSGATDASSNVRTGRLVRAGRVVQGAINQLGAANLRVDAAVIDVPTSQVRGNAQASNSVDAVFDLEKQLALGLFSQLGVTLTAAERNAIEQRPTRSLAAFLAYSRGLTAEDQGRYDDATRYFNDAVRIDPGFNAAQQKSSESRAAQAGAAVTATTVENSLKGTAEGAVVTAATQGSPVAPSGGSTGLGSTVAATAGDLNPSASGAATGGAVGGAGITPPGSKDPVSAGTGSDNPTGTAKVTIIITRPKTP